MEDPIPLPETLERLGAAIKARGLDRADVLDPITLARGTALEPEAVCLLLAGEAPPAEEVNDRVRARLKAVAAAHMAATSSRMSDLVAELHEHLGVSEMWARQVCDGKKLPNLELLHGLVDFFKVKGGEAYFFDPADKVLSRVLLAKLRELESDPVQALLDQYGVRATDLRAHGSMNRDQLERLLKSVIRSVVSDEDQELR